MKPKTSPLIGPISHPSMRERFMNPNPIGSGLKQTPYSIRRERPRAEHCDLVGKINLSQGCHEIRRISKLAISEGIAIHAPVDSKMYFRNGSVP